MPNRILRDTTDSERINKLSVQAERFLYRLFMKADDFGCFFADPRLLKAHLFPLQLDTIKEAEVKKWRDECTRYGLIAVYRSKDKEYLEIANFKQSLRQKRHKFPMQADCLQDASILQADCKAEENPNPEKKPNPETETEKAAQPLIVPYSSDEFLRTWDILREQPKWKNKSKTALQLSLKILGKNCEADAIKMMENSIANDWQGLFELKDGKKRTSNNLPKGHYPVEEYNAAIRDIFGKRSNDPTTNTGNS